MMRKAHRTLIQPIWGSSHASWTIGFRLYHLNLSQTFLFLLTSQITFPQLCNLWTELPCVLFPCIFHSLVGSANINFSCLSARGEDSWIYNILHLRHISRYILVVVIHELRPWRDRGWMSLTTQHSLLLLSGHQRLNISGGHCVLLCFYNPTYYTLVLL